MKKLFYLLTMTLLFTFVTVNVMAQSENNSATDQTATEQVQQAASNAQANAAVPQDEVQSKESYQQLLKRYFIEGGAGFMTTVLLCLIFGLALAINKIIYLTMSTTNSAKLLNKLEAKLKSGDKEGAMNVCRNTRGPLASVFYQGLTKYEDGVDMVEKSLTSYGGVAVGNLEKGLSWISLFISLAPSLGFLGTVIGMIQAFDKISVVGEMSPAVVAGGMKVALLTTLFGLVVAIILQIFYNYILTKIESITIDMEDSSIAFLDMVADNPIRK